MNIHDSNIGGEREVFLENIYRTQLIRYGYAIWDNFIYALFSLIRDVKCGAYEQREELVFRAGNFRSAILVASRIIAEIEERRLIRSSRFDLSKHVDDSRTKALTLYAKRDLDIRFSELKAELDTIAHGLESLSSVRFDENSADFKRMADAAKNWVGLINSLNIYPSSVRCTADYLESRFKNVKVSRGFDPPPNIDQIVLNAMVAELILDCQRHRCYGLHFEINVQQRRGGLLMDIKGVKIPHDDLLTAYASGKGISNVLTLLNHLGVKNVEGKYPEMKIASNSECEMWISIDWNEGHEKDEIPPGWSAIGFRGGYGKPISPSQIENTVSQG